MSADSGWAERWTLVRRELALWEEAGSTARLWLRDDDAASVTPALIRLCELCKAHAVPALLAAIPSQADGELAGYLSGHPLVEVASHGWTHRNHGLPGRKAEFPDHRPHAEVLRELRWARERTVALFGSQAVPIYVPPWNRISSEVADLLPHAEFCALSTIGRDSVAGLRADVRQINVHLDIIDWRGSRGGRDRDELVEELANHLAWARSNGGTAIGVLTHHLVHDGCAWEFLDELFAETAACRAAQWVRASDLLTARLDGSADPH